MEHCSGCLGGADKDAVFAPVGCSIESAAVAYKAKKPKAAEPASDLHEAIAGANRVFASALSRLGLKPDVIEALDKWQTTMRVAGSAQLALAQQRQLLEMNARMEKLEEQQVALLAFVRHAEPMVLGTVAHERMPKQETDPMDGLSAVAMGEQLGKLSAVTVRKREQEGALFSVLASGRTRGRLYPAFQAWEGIVGEPLRAVLIALRDAGAASGSTAHVFFAGATDLLGNLTPVEALLGKLLASRPLDPAVMSFLARPLTERLEAVIAAAKAHAASAGT
jgi:hypothetical protein